MALVSHPRPHPPADSFQDMETVRVDGYHVESPCVVVVNVAWGD